MSPALRSHFADYVYVYEKKSPAFYKNLVHLLVGPLWIVAKATGRG